MKTLFTISWRNIWRHPARSSVLLAAIIVGLWAGVVTVGIINGLMQQRIDYMIESEITHAQVHNPDFLAEGYSWLYIPDHDEITAWLENDDRVTSFTSRTITDGMLQSPIKTSGVRIRGINIDSEIRTTNFHENIVEGEYLDSDIRNAVIIGQKLANDHNVEVGNRIVLTFEDTGNELTSGSFNIAGIFKSASVDYDERNVFIRSDEFIALLGDEEVYHEIGIMLADEELAGPVVEELNEAFPGIHAQTWRQLSPELSMLVELGGYMVILITMIIMIALAFGILNTMLMALFERMREIGMLLSIGMSRLRVFSMIMLESIILTITGAAVGIILATLSINYFSDTGINLEMFAEGAAQVGWDHIIYPILSSTEYIIILAVVVIITLLASVYPAIKGIRINPLEAAKDG
ncbi:MAG: ABC transporter permease [Balneolaceae bacterium]|nr:ABC transporter permease [Balneolaceae bacterium]